MTETLEATETERKVRVYAASQDDDFVITLPAGCSLTFGYFNPGKSQGDNDEFGSPNIGYNRGKGQAERRSALRVYGPGAGAKKDQLACFLGVKGFRDESIKMTKLVRKVTVEQRFVDDGEGNVEHSGKRLAELTMRGEDDQVF